MKLLQYTQRVLALCLCAATLCLAACNSGLDTEFGGGGNFGDDTEESSGGGIWLSGGNSSGGSSSSIGSSTIRDAANAFGISATPSKTYTGSYSGDDGEGAYTVYSYLALYDDDKALFVTKETFSGRSTSEAYYGSYTQSGNKITISSQKFWKGTTVIDATTVWDVIVSGNSIVSADD